MNPVRTTPLKDASTAFVAVDPQMIEIVKLLKRLARAPSNVLLSGESGTGKDLAAHAVHYWGPRADLPFAKVDLPSIPAALVESELFGYERGAFTGAAARKAGKLELAGGGTLFLDHVAELPSALQAKLLRVVEDRRFERLGGAESVALEARIVASASADLEQAVERGLFRRDLFHRLGVFLVRLPPLRERTRDIAPLASFFLDTLALLGSAEREPERRARVALRLSAEALEALEAYSWPGNVRELKAVVEHGALVSRTEAIERTDLPAYVLDGPRRGLASGKSERMTLEELEKSYIERVLREVGGNQTKAAEILGISRKSLWERRRRYGLG